MACSPQAFATLAELGRARRAVACSPVAPVRASCSRGQAIDLTQPPRDARRASSASTRRRPARCSPRPPSSARSPPGADGDLRGARPLRHGDRHRVPARRRSRRRRARSSSPRRPPTRMRDAVRRSTRDRAARSARRRHLDALAAGSRLVLEPRRGDARIVLVRCGRGGRLGRGHDRDRRSRDRPRPRRRASAPLPHGPDRDARPARCSSSRKGNALIGRAHERRGAHRSTTACRATTRGSSSTPAAAAAVDDLDEPQRHVRQRQADRRARPSSQDGDKIQVGRTTVLRFAYHDALDEIVPREPAVVGAARRPDQAVQQALPDGSARQRAQVRAPPRDRRCRC